MSIFAKFDKTIDVKGLKDDVKNIIENGGGDFKEVPLGDYEVKISKLELKVSKNGSPMLSCWMKILSGEFKNSIIFLNQVLTTGFGIHNANEFLKSLKSGVDVDFETYTQYENLILDIAEAIEGKLEYAVEYGETSKGFKTYKIKEVFDI